MLLHRQTIAVNVPHKVFLPWFVERSPVGLFNASGLIPGVAAVAGQSGPWTSAGQQRRLTLTDGSTIVEEIMQYKPPDLFRYRMMGFTGVMARLVSEIRGVWRITETNTDTVRVEWSYEFEERGRWQRAILSLMAHLAWSTYMTASLERVAAAARSECADAGQSRLGS